jgi:hypothetical protein
MRALYNANPELTPEKVQSLVEKRLGRQEMLRRDDPPDLWAILDEVVLRRPVGGSAVMHEQLKALLPLVDASHTTIQVLPFTVGEFVCLSATHVLLTLPDNSTTAYMEASGYGEACDDPKIVARRQREYDRMKAYALSPRESATLIEAAMEAFKSCEPRQT